MDEELGFVECFRVSVGRRASKRNPVDFKLGFRIRVGALDSAVG